MLHEILKNKKVILASSSPRRCQLLNQVGINFIQIIPDIDETIINVEKKDIELTTIEFAKSKSEYIAQKVEDDCLIIAADTIVYLDNKIYGKPQNKDMAQEYLKALSGKLHEVYTGLSVCNKLNGKNFSIASVERTTVRIVKLTDEDINLYLDLGEYADKAGAYAIQGYFSQFIDYIEGQYDNVMGLPITKLYKIIKKLMDYTTDDFHEYEVV